MLIYLLARFIGWLYGVQSPINEWPLYFTLMFLSFVETMAEAVVAIISIVCLAFKLTPPWNR